MTPSTGDLDQKLLMAAFRMPSVQTMKSRSSSITNAFVSAIIPVIPPTHEEVYEALSILGMKPSDVRCAYCGDKSSEWDHLRPLVSNRQPTGYISEIGNLVPACGKCNQSKGNKPWRDWMLSKAKQSPAGRGIADVLERIARLERYQNWRTPTKIDFKEIVGEQTWGEYWQMWKDLLIEMNKCQELADSIRVRVAERIRSPGDR